MNYKFCQVGCTYLQPLRTPKRSFEKLTEIMGLKPTGSHDPLSKWA